MTSLTDLNRRDRETFGEFIRREREVRGLSLRRMARMMGVSISYLCRIELGRDNPPSEPRMRDIVKIIDVDLDVLLAMAGRASSELVEIIIERPALMAALIRSAGELSDLQLTELATEAYKMAHLDGAPAYLGESDEITTTSCENVLDERVNFVRANAGAIGAPGLRRGPG